MGISSGTKTLFILCACMPAMFLVSCRAPCRGWELCTIKAVYPRTSYAKARLRPINSFNGIEVELLSTEGDIEIYLNAFTLCFPASGCEEEGVQVDLAIDGQTYSFISERLLGGQRIKLAEEAKQLIIAALLDDAPISVSIGRYQTLITSDNFEKVYSRLSIASKY